MTPANAAEIELNPKNHIASVAKAVRLLESFGDERPELTLAELVSKCGYSRTTTYRLLDTLELLGWVERSGSGAYSLTLRVFELSSSVLGRFDLRAEASHVMSDLAARYDENIYLVVPDGDRAVCLELIESSQPVRIMALTVGRSLPLYAGGAPLALLAELHHQHLDRIVEIAPLTLPSGDTLSGTELRAAVDRVQKLGYAVSLEDVTPGIAAIGACIHDRFGRPVAAMSFGGMISRYQEPRLGELTAALQEATATVSRRLGYKP